MSFNAAIRWRDRRYGFSPRGAMLRHRGQRAVISWAGHAPAISRWQRPWRSRGVSGARHIVLTAFLWCWARC